MMAVKSVADLNSVGSRPTSTNHATSNSGSVPVQNRRPGVPPSTSPAPQLFDFAKTDSRPSSHGRPSTTSRAVSTSVVPASVPTRGHILAHPRTIHPTPHDDMELDMDFDGEEEDDEEGGSGSGSAELDMDMDEIDELDEESKDAWRKLALGTGSGGVKGRRKGMVFKCEHCNKVGRATQSIILYADTPCRNIAIRAVSSSIDGNTARIGRSRRSSA